MLRFKRMSFFVPNLLLVAFLASVLFIPGCAKEKLPEWKVISNKIIKEHKLTSKNPNDFVETNVTPSLEPGVVTKKESLPVIEIAPGCKAQMYWGKGNLINWMMLDPGAEIPKETLTCDRVLVVWKGSVDQLINGEMVTMVAIPAEPVTGTTGGRARNDCVILDRGSDNAMKAGKDGAEVLEVYSPVRLDYVQKAGGVVPEKQDEGKFSPIMFNPPNQVFDLNDVQFSELVNEYANSRIINTNSAQLSFLRMDPNWTFDIHIHPEEQLMIVLRGWVDETINDKVARMEIGDILYLPANMVHAGTNSPMGCDVLDVFYPVRPDYEAKKKARMDAYNAIIPADAKVELVVDGAKKGPGLVFGEGPCWQNGKLYFSSMFFAKDWAGDPKKSSLVEMDADGNYRYISKGLMQTNGIAAMPNGNLAVCDMFGHRVIEMTTKGKIVRVIADKFDGKRLDGPNDLVIDAKGGIYFTDPQFVPDREKSVHGFPARCVYYVKSTGEVIRVIEPNAFAMPNGVALSSDGKILYVNNTYDNESWWNVDSDKDNWVWAYDVNDDGTLANGRKFACLYLSPEVLDRQGKTTSADGMRVDANGNLYVATIMGIQIFNPKGQFIGIVNFPVMTVSLAFGGPDLQTLYATCYNKVYKIHTNMKGFLYPEQVK